MIFKLITTTILLFAASIAFCQKYVDTNDPQKQEIKSLLNKNNDINGFGGADLRVGDFKNERGLMFGAYGGMIINRRFLFGVAGYGLVTNLEFDGVLPNNADTTKLLNLHGGYGGFLLGVAIAPKELVHIHFPIIFGAGSFEVVDKNFFPNMISDTEFTIENSIYFVIEPGIELEINVSSHFRMGVGASYRHIAGLDLANLSDEDVSSLNGIVSFKFGRF